MLIFVSFFRSCHESDEGWLQMVNDKRQNRMYSVRCSYTIHKHPYFESEDKFMENVFSLKKICGRNGIDKMKCRFLYCGSLMVVDFFPNMHSFFFCLIFLLLIFFEGFYPPYNQCSCLFVLSSLSSPCKCS